MLNHIEHNSLSRRTATSSQTWPVCNKAITQFLPAIHTRTIVSVLPSQGNRPLTGTKLYCLVTEAHRCEKLAQSFFTPWCPAETQTCDLLIASPTLYHNTTTPPMTW